MEQPPNLVCCRIATRDVRSFVTVAVQAGERQIRGVAASSVLPGNDVVYLEREPVVRKRNTAVFAPAPGSVPDLFCQPWIHCGEEESSCVRR